MQGKQLRCSEAELWRDADQLRAYSKLTASECLMPVLGLIFLRHAFNRFQKVKIEVGKTFPLHPQRANPPFNVDDVGCEERLEEIHIELEGLNEETIVLQN